MGSSGELQYVLPIVMIAVFINYCVVNFETKKLKYIGYIIIFCYIGVKIILYNLLKLNSSMINIHIVAFIIINLSFIFRNKIWSHKIKDKSKLIWDLKFGVFYGVLMLIILVYISFNERLYINKYNLIIMFIEYILVGITYIITSQYMIKKIENNQ